MTNQNQNRIPLKFDKSKLNSILRLEFDIFTIMYLFLLKSLEYIICITIIYNYDNGGGVFNVHS